MYDNQIFPLTRKITADDIRSKLFSKIRFAVFDAAVRLGKAISHYMAYGNLPH